MRVDARSPLCRLQDVNLQPPDDNMRVDARSPWCRLQDLNLQPPYDNVRVDARSLLCRLQDLNLQPPYYKYGALPIAPSRHDRLAVGRPRERRDESMRSSRADYDDGVGVGEGLAVR